ncbi:MAG: WhiB family transcriptional regulator [Actinomycetota bacterium]|nr:WhiB family transcriptional regulator [Actinomycetota bacterium]
MTTLPLSAAPWPGPWYLAGRCRSVPTDVFFPASDDDLDAARAICRPCPVRQHCADYAIALPELLGVWGGLSEQDRRRARNYRKHPPQQNTPGAHQPTTEPEQDLEPGPVERAAPPGSLLATLTALTDHPNAWAIVVHYQSPNSASATASLLRTGKRPSPPGGNWQFEGHLNDGGGSDLWARYNTQPAPIPTRRLGDAGNEPVTLRTETTDTTPGPLTPAANRTTPGNTKAAR